MQIQLKSPELIPTDPTLKHSKSKITQLSIQLDGNRYTLLKRLGRVFERTNKDIVIDLLDLWIQHNIEMFPVDEQQEILALIEERRIEHSISHRKP